MIEKETTEVKNYNEASNNLLLNNLDLSYMQDGIVNEIIKDLKIIGGKKTIHANINFLKWYFFTKVSILNDNQKDEMLNVLTYAMIEDPYCFMRILFYIANTRRTTEQELGYKAIIIFIGTMFPEIIMANVEMMISIGKKDDILYLIQCQGIAEKIVTWVKHKAKEDDDFKILLTGKLIKSKINRFVYYKPKLTKGSKWDVFLNKILDDPGFNGITI